MSRLSQLLGVIAACTLCGCPFAMDDPYSVAAEPDSPDASVSTVTGDDAGADPSPPEREPVDAATAEVVADAGGQEVADPAPQDGGGPADAETSQPVETGQPPGNDCKKPCGHGCERMCEDGEPCDKDHDCAGEAECKKVEVADGEPKKKVCVEDD